MPRTSPAPTVLIRAARGSDGPALRVLAALDSADVPAGELLVAEIDSELVAAVAPESGETIATPFRRTHDVVALLRLRAELGARGTTRRRVRGARTARRAHAVA